jgi:anti-sigma regulatory factor (Ser/Thr protein kinase)/GNAT superfamily N-acetyltransferase
MLVRGSEKKRKGEIEPGMTSMLDCNLNVPPTLASVAPVAAMVRSWAAGCGLDAGRAAALSLATDELLTDVALFAFPRPKGTETVEVSLERTAHTLEVRIQERGEPFDPDMHPWHPEEAATGGSFDGAGFALIEDLVDRFVFLNRGIQGKQFRLFAKLPRNAIVVPTRTPAVVEEDPNYHLAVATPADAEDISRLIHRTYGYSYRKEETYFPARVALALERNEKFGVVVRTDAGTPVGWFAVLKGTDSNIGEVGEAVVSPEHRHRGIMTKMMDSLIAESRRRGLLGLFGQAVTAHEFSQRVNAHYDFHSTALLLADYPAMRFKDLADHYPQDISVVIDYRPLTKESSHPLFLPRYCAKIIRDVVANFDWRLEPVPSITPPLVGKSDLEVKLDLHDHKTTIVGHHLGEDLSIVLPVLLNELSAHNVQTIYFDAPFDVPEVRSAIPKLRECGFIFAGLMPRFHHERDYLRLQHVTSKLDFRLIRIYSETAKALKRRVHREYPS